MNDYLAQSGAPIGEPLRGIGPLGLDGAVEAGGAPVVFNKFVSTTIGVMTIIAAVWFIFLFISGAIAVLASGGDKGKVEAARTRLAYGVIGIGIVVAAIFIIQILGRILGLDILNPADFITNLYK